MNHKDNCPLCGKSMLLFPSLRMKALVKRQPLSDEAIRAVYYSQLEKFGQLCDMDDIEFFARAIEAAHGITNEP